MRSPVPLKNLEPNGSNWGEVLLVCTLNPMEAFRDNVPEELRGDGSDGAFDPRFEFDVPKWFDLFRAEEIDPHDLEYVRPSCDAGCLCGVCALTHSLCCCEQR